MKMDIRKWRLLKRKGEKLVEEDLMQNARGDRVRKILNTRPRIMTQ